MMTTTTMTMTMTRAHASHARTGRRAVMPTATAASMTMRRRCASRVSVKNTLLMTTTKATSTTAMKSKARVVITRAASGDDGEDAPFGYTRKDVMLLGGGLTGAGFASYYGLQSFAGIDAVKAGNAVQLTFVLGLTLVWVASYVLRVFNKDMTYVKQLKDYEDAVMQKRLEEMPEAELTKMMQQLKDDDE